MTTAALHWQRVPALTGLRTPDMAAAWNRLNAMRGDLPFLDSRVILAALDEFGSGKEQLLVAHDATGPVAHFVLVPKGRLRWETFQPSQIPLGAWVARSDLPLDALALDLVRRPLGLCLSVSLTQTDPSVAARAADSPFCRTDDYIDTAWLDIAGSFDDYWAQRGKNLRQNLRKQRNRLAADDTETSLRVWRSPEDMAPALERYGRMEATGWKAGEGTAIEAGNAQGRFYRRLLEDAARVGEAVVYEYLFGHQTVAMNLCLLRNGQLVVLKTTYDEAHKSHSPAFLLREDELRQFYGAQDVRRIEYFGRVMDWHLRLTDDKRTLYHLTCFRWPWLKQLAARRRTVPAAVGSASAATEAQAA